MALEPFKCAKCDFTSLTEHGVDIHVGKEHNSAAGRPTVMTPDIIRKLEEAFAIGCSDSEACSYADIGQSTLYSYQEKHPEFAERKEKLKERPILKARQTVVKGLDQVEHAKWYLERRKKAEFAQRTEQTGAGGEAINYKFTWDDGDNQDTLPTSQPSEGDTLSTETMVGDSSAS